MSAPTLRPQPNLEKDWLLEQLGSYLKRDMNRRGIEAGIRPVINTFYTYDNQAIAHDKYPVLTLVRTSDNWKRDGGGFNSNIQIKYYLDYRNLQKHLGFSYWFSYHMHEALSAWTLGGGQEAAGEYITYDMRARYYTDEVSYRESVHQNREPYLAVWTASLSLKTT